MILRVTTEGFEPQELPEKFEAGTPPIAEAIGLDAAIQYVTTIGMEKIQAHERELCRYADAAIRQIDGVRVIGPQPDQKVGIVTFVIDRSPRTRRLTVSRHKRNRRTSRSPLHDAAAQSARGDRIDASKFLFLQHDG